MALMDISICMGKRKARFDVNQNELSRFPVVEISGIEPLTLECHSSALPAELYDQIFPVLVI